MTYRRKIFAGPQTVADLWAAYTLHLGDRPTAKTLSYTGKSVLPIFGELRHDEITVDHCRRYGARRKRDGVKIGTVHTELGHLRSALNWGVKMRLIPFAPHIERPSKPQPKDRFLTREEIKRLLAVEMPSHVRLAILLMLGTAARVGAILDLTWDRVDLKRRVIDLRVDAEGPRKGRAVVPISEPLARALLASKALTRSKYVIAWNGHRVACIRTGIVKAAARAGLCGVSPHVFRHSAAVHLAEGGISMEELAQFLGHSDINVTRRVYARYSPTHLRRASELLVFQ